MENKSLEQMLDELSKIATSLKSENVGIDKSIELYEEGIKLAKMCEDRLTKAEGKLVELSKEANDLLKEREM